MWKWHYFYENRTEMRAEITLVHVEITLGRVTFHFHTFACRFFTTRLGIGFCVSRFDTQFITVYITIPPYLDKYQLALFGIHFQAVRLHPIIDKLQVSINLIITSPKVSSRTIVLNLQVISTLYEKDKIGSHWNIINTRY
jgi:hypothetical protein